MLKKEELIPGHWYNGKGRNSNVGRWDAKGYFVTVGYKFGYDVTYHEGYWEPDGGCFAPFEEINEKFIHAIR
jgi:WXXGXW repeat (2 copies)